MPTVLQQILHPKVNNKQAVKKRAAACKSKAHKLQKLITNKKAKGQETDLLENTLTKTHSDYIKNDLQDQFNTMDISAMMGETHAVLLNRHPDHGIGMRVVSCTGIPYLRVSEIVLNGSAHTSGLIRLGDRVLRINGKDMHGVAPKIALRELKHDETVALVLGRDASPLDPAKAEAPLVVRCSRIPMPMRPPLLTQLSKLEAEVQGRELVLGYINDGVESDVIRYVCMHTAATALLWSILPPCLQLLCLVVWGCVWCLGKALCHPALVVSRHGSSWRVLACCPVVYCCQCASVSLTRGMVGCDMVVR